MNAEKSTLPDKLNALPLQWVEKIFSHMAAYYGTLFVDRWKGLNLDEVKAVWSKELATFSDNPECFKRALKALVEGSTYPPTLPEFVKLCRQHYERPALPALEHKFTDEEVERNKERIASIREDIARRFA